MKQTKKDNRPLNSNNNDLAETDDNKVSKSDVYIGKNFEKSDKRVLFVTSVTDVKNFVGDKDNFKVEYKIVSKKKGSKEDKPKIKSYKDYFDYLKKENKINEFLSKYNRKYNAHLSEDDIALYNYIYDCDVQGIKDKLELAKRISGSVILSKLKSKLLDNKYNEMFQKQVSQIEPCPQLIVYVSAQIERTIRRQGLKLDAFLSNLGINSVILNSDGKQNIKERRKDKVHRLFELINALRNINIDLSYLKRKTFPELNEFMNRKKLEDVYKATKDIREDFFHSVQLKLNDSIAYKKFWEKLKEYNDSDHLVANFIGDENSENRSSSELEKFVEKNYPIEYGKFKSAYEKIQSMSGFSEFYLDNYIKFCDVGSQLDEIIECIMDDIENELPKKEGEDLFLWQEILKEINKAECFVPLPMFMKIIEMAKDNYTKACELFHYYFDYVAGTVNRILEFNDRFQKENKNRSIVIWDGDCDRKLNKIYNKINEEPDAKEILEIMKNRLFHVEKIKEMEIKLESNFPSWLNNSQRKSLLTDKEREKINRQLWKPKKKC